MDIIHSHPFEKLSRRAAIRLALCGCAAPLALRFGTFALGAPLASPMPQVEIPPTSILEPIQLAGMVVAEKPSVNARSDGRKAPAESAFPFTVICVGFKFLYDTAHVPGALFLGPAREAGGLAALEQWARTADRKRMTVLYCGCCPWDKCPNIRPAYTALSKMSFPQLRVMRIDQDFAANWVKEGLPTAKK